MGDCGRYWCPGICLECDDLEDVESLELQRQWEEEEFLREAAEFHQAIATGDLTVHQRLRDGEGTLWLTGTRREVGDCVVLADYGHGLAFVDQVEDRHIAAQCLAQLAVPLPSAPPSGAFSRVGAVPPSSRVRAALARSPRASTTGPLATPASPPATPAERRTPAR